MRQETETQSWAPHAARFHFSADTIRAIAECRLLYGLTSTSLEDDLASIINSLSRTPRVEFHEVVSDIAEEVALFAEQSDSNEVGSYCLILLNSAWYFDCIGNPLDAMRYGKAAAQIALKSRDLLLIRRAHNILGGMHARNFDFENACFCLSEARRISLSLSDRVLLSAVLGNTAAALEIMGLQEEALRMALSVTKMGDGSLRSATVQLANANNGVRLSRRLNDKRSAKTFFRVLNTSARTLGPVATILTRAYLTASRVTYYLMTSRIERAGRLVNAALKRHKTDSGPRIEAILLTSRAEYHAELGIVRLINQSANELLHVTRNPFDLGADFDLVLDTLIHLCETLGGDCDAHRYRTLLTRYIVGVKHRLFFEGISNDLLQGSRRLREPTYSVPEWVFPAAIEESARLRISQDLKKCTFSLLEPSDSLLDEAEATHFRIASAWVVAMESRMDNGSSHSLHVAETASAIAAALGCTPLYCGQIRLAAFLHDVGMLATFKEAGSEASRSEGDYQILREHTTIGGEVLSLSTHPVLSMARDIAIAHHESWNGTGYPFGLRAQEIPLSARICAVADAYVCLSYADDHQECWAFKAAIRQVQCMGGVQLDPDIVLTFVNAFRDQCDALGHPALFLMTGAYREVNEIGSVRVPSGTGVSRIKHH